MYEYSWRDSERIPLDSSSTPARDQDETITIRQNPHGCQPRFVGDNQPIQKYQLQHRQHCKNQGLRPTTSDQAPANMPRGLSVLLLISLQVMCCSLFVSASDQADNGKGRRPEMVTGQDDHRLAKREIDRQTFEQIRNTSPTRTPRCWGERNVPIIVCTYTGAGINSMGGSTDDDVWVELSGQSKCHSRPIYIDDPDRDDFQTRRRDCFQLNIADIGSAVTTVSLLQGPRVFGYDCDLWQLLYVAVEYKGNCYVFKGEWPYIDCHSWYTTSTLAQLHIDNMVHLLPERLCPPDSNANIITRDWQITDNYKTSSMVR